MRRFLFAVVVLGLVIWIVVGAAHRPGLWGDGSTCPYCGSTEDVVPIEYGYPAEEALKAARQGQIVCGGCMVSWNSPRWHCQRCGNEWGQHWKEILP